MTTLLLLPSSNVISTFPILSTINNYFNNYNPVTFRFGLFSFLITVRLLYLVRQLVLYSHSVWFTYTVCSLFRYFSITLFLFIQLIDKFWCVLSCKISIFFNIASIKTLIQYCISVKKIVHINSLNRAIVLFAAYVVFGRIFALRYVTLRF